MRRKTNDLTLAAVMAAAYVVLTLPFAQFSFGIIQFRLAEAMTALAVLTPAAIPGLALGCLLANLLNPMNLGPVDIIGGSLATFAASVISWKLSVYFRRRENSLLPVRELSLGRKFLAVTPAVIANALIVGTYLPFLLIDEGSAAVTAGAVIVSIGSILLCEAVVVYLIGLPLLTAMSRTRLAE